MTNECAHDLAPGTCAICATPRPAADWAALRRRSVARVFEARYPGECAGCGEPIEPGDQVSYVDDELLGGCCAGA